MEGEAHSMIILSTGASVLAHGVHYGVLAVGLLGLVVMLAPGFATHRQAPLDAHEHRVQALRSQLQPGTVMSRPVAGPAVAVARTAGLERTLLPFAVVSSAAAAGVHAAVGPAHFRESTLFGLFFAGSATLQIIWSVAVVARPTRRLFLIGAAGNVAVVALWAVTRTYGLPWGLLPVREAVGVWDASCGLWELAVAGACVALLRSGPKRLRVPSWTDWSVLARSWAGFSVAGLVVLSFSGAGA